MTARAITCWPSTDGCSPSDAHDDIAFAERQSVDAGGQRGIGEQVARCPAGPGAQLCPYPLKGLWADARDGRERRVIPAGEVVEDLVGVLEAGELPQHFAFERDLLHASSR